LAKPSKGTHDSKPYFWKSSVGGKRAPLRFNHDRSQSISKARVSYIQNEPIKVVYYFIYMFIWLDSSEFALSYTAYLSSVILKCSVTGTFINCLRTTTSQHWEARQNCTVVYIYLTSHLQPQYSNMISARITPSTSDYTTVELSHRLKTGSHTTIW